MLLNFLRFLCPFLRRQDNLLSFHDFGDVQVEEIAVEHGLFSI